MTFLHLELRSEVERDIENAVAWYARVMNLRQHPETWRLSER
jgi:hypothetical protein